MDQISETNPCTGGVHCIQTNSDAFVTDNYAYDLPSALIAQHPLEQRDRSRMLVLRRATGAREHSFFYRLPEHLQCGDLLVLNNTRVIPARLPGRRATGGGRAELLLLHRQSPRIWKVMVKPGRRLMPGSRVLFAGGLEATIREYCGEGLRTAEFSQPLEELLPQLGQVPLPPYIKVPLRDPAQYQTIYAAIAGSSAAPTAGFHFTPQVFAALAGRGIRWTFVTLHIGPGTFRPVQDADLRKHVMHREHFCLDEKSVELINETRAGGGKVVAVGTTAVRVLESAAGPEGMVQPRDGWTGLFIYPGFRFRVVGALLTNFHLPRSTLLMLVSAFAGRESILEAYREAVQERYRFFSFGDCMLIR